MTWDNLHEEDILYEFEGDSPDQLTRGRFYRGEVDGFADFGVFVQIGNSVTGLLHRSKLDRRLESLDWSAGEEVIVQVEGVRDNGNVDLDWSIRQSEREFRGSAIEGPSGETRRDTEPDERGEAESTTLATDGNAATHAPKGVEAVARAATDELADLTGERVRLEGRITDVRQTTGPTVFTLTDEAGSVECAAFESAGERAYPDIEADAIVHLIGIVERHRGSVQIETEAIEPLEGDEREAVTDGLREAARERASPDDATPLVEDETVAALQSDMESVATLIREATLASRPIVIRHPPTVDGVVAGAAIERAIRRISTDDTGHRRVRRRPMREPWYDLGDAMYDLGAGDDDEVPLVILVGAGTTTMDQAALEFLSLYDVDRLILDAFDRAEDIEGVTEGSVIGGVELTTATVAAHVAGMVASDIRSALAPLPAISYGDRIPDPYQRLAADHGVDPETIAERHQALALFAFYQRYDDKRELVADLLFDGAEATHLAEHVSTQYRERIETALQTARENCERVSVVGGTLVLLDAEEHTHRFDFPPRSVLAAELFAVERGAEDADAVAVLGTDECHLAAVGEIDLPAVAAEIDEVVPDAAVAAARDRLTFLAGKRDEVKGALVDVLAGLLS